MSRTEEVIMDPHDLDQRVAQGGVLLGIGSIHDEQADEAIVAHSGGEMHEELLEIEASIMRPTATPATERPSNETAQDLAHPSQSSTQPPPSSSVTGISSSDVNNKSLNSSRLQSKTPITKSTDHGRSMQKESDPETKVGEHGDNLSTATERSQRSGNQSCNVEK